jgi:hypothetical protein
MLKRANALMLRCSDALMRQRSSASMHQCANAPRRQKLAALGRKSAEAHWRFRRRFLEPWAASYPAAGGPSWGLAPVALNDLAARLFR